jgi:glycerol-3-phosphate dehydrogenase
VFGGKLTTYRKLAESAMAQLAPFFSQIKPSWTAKATLPGAENMTTPQALSAALTSKYSWLDAAIAKRWAITYGSRSWNLLEGMQGLSDMGEHIGSGLYSREVDYLCSQEWALDAQDILWRRTKLGLFTTAQEQEHLVQYMATLDLKHRKVEAA